MFRNEPSLRDRRLSGSTFLAIRSEKEDEGFGLQLGQERVHVRGPAPQDKPEVLLDVLLCNGSSWCSKPGLQPSHQEDPLHQAWYGYIKAFVILPKI